MRVAARVRVPALVVSAQDDPFVPPGQFDAPDLAGNPAVTRLITQFGGHCGFVEAPRDDDGYWAERVAIGFVAARTSVA